MMVDIHKAALKRAYRTLAQGLGGSAVSTALTAAITGGDGTLIALAATLGSTAVAAFASFWQGVAQGLPEVELAEELENAGITH